MNALVCWAHHNNLLVTLDPLDREHVLATVLHLGTDNAAHALLAEALVGPVFLSSHHLL